MEENRSNEWTKQFGGGEELETGEKGVRRNEGRMNARGSVLSHER